MATADAFHAKVKAVIPTGDEGGLQPGTVFIAVLKHEKKPTDIIGQSDIIWMRCPEGRRLAAACTAYKKLSGSGEDLVFRHDFKPINGTEVVSRLNLRQDTLVVLEAVEASDIAARNTELPPERTPLRSIDINTTILSSQMKAELKDNKPLTPKKEDARLNPLQDMPAQIHPVQNDNALQPAQDQLHDRAMFNCGWIDFVCERRAFLQTQRPLNTAAQVASMDACIRMEWTSMQQPERAFFDARAPQISPVFGDWIPGRCAFWHYYYHRLAVHLVSGTDHHRDFQSNQIFLASMIREWASAPADNKDLRTQRTAGFLRRFPLPEPPVVPVISAAKPINTDIAQSAVPPPVEMAGKSNAASTSQELPQEIRLNISDLFANSTPEQLEAGVEKGVSILDDLRASLETQLANSVDAVQWIQAIDSVHKQAVKTKTIVGIVGSTGAGKSSVINALLEEERLVPTNCMRACTSVVTEISMNYEDVPYRAEIEFIGADDWYKELKTLFQDLLDHEGKVSRESTNEESEAGVAYAKLKSVYPRLTKEDMQSTTPEELMAHENVKCLGSLRKLQDHDSLVFYKKLQGYVDSKEKAGTKSADKSEKKRKGPREMEYWPLIRVVRIYTKAAALATGAVLVDLPGVHDSNQARAAVAQGYLKQCTGLWIVAPITRAVDDKSAKILLGDSFKRQLKMDGGYNSVTFICSKTDDISLMEATASLGLEDEVGNLWLKIDAYDEDTRELEKELTEHRGAKRDVSAAMDQAEEDLEVWEKLRDDIEEGKTVYPPKVKSAKRKRATETASSRKKSRVDDSDDNFIDDESDDNGASGNDASDNNSSGEDEVRDPLTADETIAKIRELKAVKKNGRQERFKLDEKISSIKKQIEDIQEQSNVLKSKIAEQCISGRNNYSRDAIRQDFAAGIKELDQELAEEEDAANFDPEKDARDYDKVARSLPVYCISSRGYQKLMGRLKKDADVAGFKDVLETEIPQLQAHCRKLTEAGREAACKRFLNSLSQLLNSLRLWSSSDGIGRNLSQGQLKRESMWLEDRLNKFDKLVERQIKQLCNRLSEEIQDNVFEAFEVAAKSASTEAGQTVQHWGQKVNSDDRAAGGLYWSTYKAVCRRDGIFRDIDFNEQLTEPVIKQIASGWEKTFQRRLPSVLTGLPTVIGDLVQNAHQDIEIHSVRGGSSVASFHILQQSIPAYKEIFKDAANTARTTITERQRDINREFTPVITEHMLDAYAGCVAEYGTGSYMRMKNLMARHVDIHRHKMFMESTSKVELLLRKLVEDVEKLLLAKADEVFHSIRRDYTRVVIGGDNSTTAQLPRNQRQMKRDILEVLEGSELRFKSVLGIGSEAKGAEADTAETMIKEQSDVDVLRDKSASKVDMVSPEAAALIPGTMPSVQQGTSDTRDEGRPAEAPARPLPHLLTEEVGAATENGESVATTDSDTDSEFLEHEAVEDKLSMPDTESSSDEDIEDHHWQMGLAVYGELDSEDDDVSRSESTGDSDSKVDYTSDEC